METKDVRDRLNNPLIVFYLFFAVFAIISPVMGVAQTSVMFPGAFVVGVIVCGYFAVRRKELKLNIVPLMMMVFVAMLFMMTDKAGAQYWAAAFGLGLFAASLWSTKLVDAEIAFIIGIFLVSTFIHAVPALITDYIEEIDPYYDYKWGAMIFDTGKIPVHDWWTYPKELGLDRSLMPFGTSLAMAYFGEILTFIGMSYHQAAILISVLAAGFSVVVMYMLIKELLLNRENAKVAAMLGAFLLMMSIGWSTKAHATDSENDAFGGFMLLMLFYIFMYAINRKNLMVSMLVGGLLFGWFAVAWDGHKIFTMVGAIAISIVSFYGLFNGKRTIDYLKHYAGIILIGNILFRFILHKPGVIFSFLMPSGIELASFALVVFAVGLNEFMLKYKDRVSKHHVLIIVAAFVIGLAVLGPTVWYNFYKVGFVDIGQPSVVFKTIAEQQPFASSISDYITNLPKVFGLMSLIALICAPFMLYVGLKEDNFGSIIMFSWLMPFAWGFYFKSQYIFLASIPFALAGGWIGQYVISSKKDSDGLKIIPTIIIICGVILYTPIGEFVSNYGVTSIFYNVATYDRMGWESTLQYFKNSTPENTAIVTWWDYGHWLTAVSHRFVLIDNLQHDHWEIQDVARFFMKVQTEDEAMKILQEYQDIYNKDPYKSMFGGVKLNYAAIDWTMIGKSGAMRFIATGNLTNQADGEYDSYTVCQFLPQYSNINGSLTTGSDGAFAMTKTLVYGCTYNKDGLNGIVFSITNNNMNVEAITQEGNRIPWKTWISSKDCSLMGVRSPQDILSVSMQYYNKINYVPPMYTNFVYASGPFKNFMLTRLYFGDNIESYKALGLANVNWSKLQHFTKDRDFEDGFVETWKINYNSTVSAAPVSGASPFSIGGGLK